MLILTKGKSNDKIIVTLTEKATSLMPSYLFVFTHVTTRETIKLTFAPSKDVSLFPERYNKFEMDTDHVFGASSSGQYLYRVYEVRGGLLATEQEQYFVLEDGQTGIELEEGSGQVIGELENGRMILNDATPFTYKQYEAATTFKTYAG